MKKPYAIQITYQKNNLIIKTKILSSYNDDKNERIEIAKKWLLEHQNKKFFNNKQYTIFT